MTWDWASFWIGVIAMPLTLATIAALIYVVSLFVQRPRQAMGPCPFCEDLGWRTFEYEMGEKTYASIYRYEFWHRSFTARRKAHRAAWQQHLDDMKDNNAHWRMFARAQHTYGVTSRRREIAKMRLESDSALTEYRAKVRAS